ncbi:hypothetical protein [Halobacillus mangrovi]|uniref:DUF4871 domain-containing protein n=1 Tax=Halobacillus mangrovi TaxID=402384 RepID=A0A1W5ZXD1_9BACI|nr:hypothetical protein [Halobacillus mangrovi]ARI77923.1 hypothetical protein HM131_14165 [Halobacillus mangrovi]
MLWKSIVVSVFIIVGFNGLLGCSNVQSDETKVNTPEASESASSPEPEITWEESPLFESKNLSFIGEEDRLGFTFDESEVMRFYPGKVQKYVWHFWGNEEELKGKLTVKAIHKETNKEITVLKELALMEPNSGADRHVPSSMSLPDSGMWKLNASIGSERYGSVIIKVYER